MEGNRPEGLGVRHYDVQILGGNALLQGKITESHRRRENPGFNASGTLMRLPDGVHMKTVNVIRPGRDRDGMERYKSTGITTMYFMT